MSSNCDSDGMPVDHDGERLEDFLPHSAPFAVRADVFHELFSGSGRDTACEHIDGHPLEGPSVVPASSGGIPFVDEVLVEDGYSSDEPLSPKSAKVFCQNSTSSTVHAILRTQKHERDSLISTRNKLNTVLEFLRSKGFSEEEIFKDFARVGLGRDEFGMPFLGGQPAVTNSNSTRDPMTAKLKEKLNNNVADEVLENMPQPEKLVSPPSGPTVIVNKSWSQVVKDPVAKNVEPPKFSYVPPLAGSTTVDPPDDALKEGTDKLKTTIVGSFTKGFAPFNKVVDFANKLWKNRGLVHVGQKDARTFFFRFDSVKAMTAALARGTWYLDRKPMVFHAWGTSVNSVKSIPLWVRFDQVPDSYWTANCLSRLASFIGPPLCADELTSRLEILPFAKMCVQYTIGDDLPTQIPVKVLNPSSGEKTEEMVLVSYPNKPMVCSACKSLGHLIGACPTVIRKWVRKEKSDAKTSDAVPGNAKSSEVPVVAPPVASSPVSKTPNSQGNLDDYSDNSVPPPNNFRNLKRVDECSKPPGNSLKPSGNSSTSPEDADFQLTRSQRKRLKRAKGKSTSPPT